MYCYLLHGNIQKETDTEAQCLASYLRGPGKLSMFFSLVFQDSSGNKFQGKKDGNLSRDPEIWCYTIQLVKEKNIYIDFMRFGDSSTVNGLHESLPRYYFKGLKQPIIIHLWSFTLNKVGGWEHSGTKSTSC